MIFQDPMTSLNPVYRVGRPDRRGDPARTAGRADAEARALAIEMLRAVGIPRPPSGACDSYPHEFSGGMRQRAMIAMALVAASRAC